MFFYLTIRFKYRFAISAILSLFHNIIILLGIISFFQIELDLTVLSAIFAVFGYSINDTVVIFDRIRENFNIYEKNKIKISDLVNMSLNKTLSRTLSTSFTTLVVVLFLLFFIERLFFFSLILFVGIIIGTYSSLYVATFLLIFFDNLNDSKKI